MRVTLTAAGLALALALAVPARAQPSKVMEAQPVEVVVVVTQVNRAARTVTVQGPKGNEIVVMVPPEARNLDQVREGSRFRMHLIEETIVSLNPDQAASGGASVVQIAPKGNIPAGIVARTQTTNGFVESVDPSSRRVTVRSQQGGNPRTLNVAGDVKLDAIKPGDRISFDYTQAIATRMVSTPQQVPDPAAP